MFAQTSQIIDELNPQSMVPFLPRDNVVAAGIGDADRTIIVEEVDEVDPEQEASESLQTEEEVILVNALGQKLLHNVSDVKKDAFNLPGASKLAVSASNFVLPASREDTGVVGKVNSQLRFAASPANKIGGKYLNPQPAGKITNQLVSDKKTEELAPKDLMVAFSRGAPSLESSVSSRSMSGRIHRKKSRSRTRSRTPLSKSRSRSRDRTTKDPTMRAQMLREETPETLTDRQMRAETVEPEEKIQERSSRSRERDASPARPSALSRSRSRDRGSKSKKELKKALGAKEKHKKSEQQRKAFEASEKKKKLNISVDLHVKNLLESRPKSMHAQTFLKNNLDLSPFMKQSGVVDAKFWTDMKQRILEQHKNFVPEVAGHTAPISHHMQRVAALAKADLEAKKLLATKGKKVE